MPSTANTENNKANPTDIATRLGRYRPKSLNDTQVESLLPAMRAVVLAAEPRTYDEARNWMSVPAIFIRDAAPPTVQRLHEILTDAAVSLWVSKCAQSGRSPHTLKTQRGTLLRLLGAQRGALTSEKRAYSDGCCTPVPIGPVQRFRRSCTAARG